MLAKELFDDAAVDFYTYHPYGRGPDLVTGGASANKNWEMGWQSLESISRGMSGKPLVFTEWGGFYVSGNPGLFTEFCEEMFRLRDNMEGEPRLAGMSYWAWSDIYEANRPFPACTAGVLTEGLVSIDRKPKNNYDTFMHLLTRTGSDYVPVPELTVYGIGDLLGGYQPVVMPAADTEVQQKAWAESVRQSLDKDSYAYTLKRRIEQGRPCRVRLQRWVLCLFYSMKGIRWSLTKSGEK